MSDPVSMSLDDYIKTQKKTGKMSFNRNRSGRRGPKQNNGGGGPGASASFGNGGRNRGGGRGRNSFRGRNGRQSSTNVQQRRGNGGFRGNRNARFNYGGSNVNANRASGGGALVQLPRSSRNNNGKRRNRNSNRQIRQQAQAGAQGFSRQSGRANFRYFQGNLAAAGGVSVGAMKPKRNLARRIQPKKLVITQQQAFVATNRNTKRAFMKLAKKRVQRAKLLVSRKKAPITGPGKLKNVISSNGRVALGKNGFVTVRNTSAKRMERALVQMKIARAQQARNRQTPPQRTVSLPGTSGGKRRARPVRRVAYNNAASAPALDWNTSIVRTMTNDLADEMSSSQLNPDIQRKIAFIQSRSKSDRIPVMPDFRAPVQTSRMTLSDRFRLIGDQ